MTATARATAKPASISGARMIFYSVAYASLAALLSWLVLQKAGTMETPVQRVGVVTAKRDIPARTVITAEMLEVRAIPEEAKLPQAVNDPGLFLNKATKQAISTGEQLLPAKVFDRRYESGLAFVIPADKRAASVKVSELIGSGGLIVPGDYVDVVGVCRTRVNPGSTAASSSRVSSEQGKAVLALQDIEVLAVAQQLLGQDAGGLPEQVNPTAKGQSRDPKPEPRAKSVTLAVTPEQTLRLVLFEELCELRLALRAAGDHGVANVGPEELYYEIARGGG